jgi:hypothetical protein
MYVDADNGATYSKVGSASTNWNQFAASSGFLPLTGGTLSGDLTISKAAATFSLDTTVGSHAQVMWKKATALRWRLGMNVVSVDDSLEFYKDAGWGSGGAMALLRFAPDGQIVLPAPGIGVTFGPYDSGIYADADYAYFGRRSVTNNALKVGHAVGKYGTVLSAGDGAGFFANARDGTGASIGIYLTGGLGRIYTGSADAVQINFTSLHWSFPASISAVGINPFVKNFGAVSLVNTVNGAVEIQSTDFGPAIMSFHRAGQYAVQFGLDTDHAVRMGGWSDGGGNWRFAAWPSGRFDTRAEVRPGTDLIIEGAYGRSVVGFYDATKYNAVWAMGGAFAMDTSGDTIGGRPGFSTFYGLVSHYDWAAPYKQLTGHSLEHSITLVSGGVARSTLGMNGIWTAGKIIAGGNMYANDFVLN